MIEATTRIYPPNIGSYDATYAARLLDMSAAKIRRWVKGYYYVGGYQKPLFPSTYALEDDLELSFRDLIELKAIHMFEKAGVSAVAIRKCYKTAQEIAEDDRPFSTLKFKTDSKNIYFDNDEKIIEIFSKQHNFKEIIEQSFVDLEIEGTVVAAWYPLKDSKIVVIDPRRSYGKPIVTISSVPTNVLYNCYLAENNSIEKTTHYFDVTKQEVEAAISFEQTLIKPRLAKAA